MKKRPHGHGAPTAPGPCPQAFLDALEYEGSDYLERPICEPPRGYSLVIGGQFDRALIQRAAINVTGLTGGAVGFDFSAPNGPEVEFVFNPNDPAVVSYRGQGITPIALTYRKHGDPRHPNVITGARVVYALPDWLGSIKVAMHELGHFLGLGHAYRDRWGDPFIMGNAPRDSDQWHDWERATWRDMASKPPGWPRVGTPPRAGSIANASMADAGPVVCSVAELGL